MVRQVEPAHGIGIVETSPFSFRQTIMQDTISKAPAIDLPYTQARIKIAPAIEEPTHHQLQRLADLLFRCHVHQLQSVEKLIASKVETLIHEKQLEAEKLMEAAKKAHHSNFWDYLKFIAGALLGAVSIIVGGTLIGVGGPLGWITGGMLVTSGVTSITASILAQMRVNPQVTSVISLVSAGLGLVGSVVSFFAVANSLPHLIAVIANSAFTVASGTATIGSEEMKRQIAELDHEMALIKKELGLDGIAIQTLSIEAQDLADDMYKNIDQCQMILAKREQIKRRMIALQLRG